MLSFILKVLAFAWKYGKAAVEAVVKWIRNNWSTVSKWLSAGYSVEAIIEIILRLLGL